MFRKGLLVLVCVLLLLPLGLPMTAQEATDVPPQGENPVDVVVTGEDTVTVTIETPRSDALPTLINIAIVFAGAIVAGGSAALVWDRIRRSKDAKDSIEHLANGLSPEWKSTIDRALDYGEAANKRLAELLQFGREITDGKPNEPPPTG